MWLNGTAFRFRSAGSWSLRGLMLPEQGNAPTVFVVVNFALCIAFGEHIFCATATYAATASGAGRRNASAAF